MAELLPADRAGLVVGSHVAAFEDNLLPSLLPEQVAELRAQLERGDGRELEFRADGSPPDAHSVRSSAVLAFNVFARWLGDERQLTLCGVTGFESRLTVEARLPIQRGGRAPNLDVLLTGAGVAVGVESKLLEPLSGHGGRTWQESYGRPHNLALLTGAWRETLEAAIAGEYTPRHLEADQPLRHGLGLNKQHSQRARHLVYCYWEPINGDTIDEVRAHRAEVADFASRVASSEPTFHALSYSYLFDEWEKRSAPAWLAEHVRALRQRYEVTV